MLLTKPVSTYIGMEQGFHHFILLVILGGPEDEAVCV